MPNQVSIHDAKTHLSRLLQRVMAGEEIIIAKSGVPIARLVPIASKKAKRTLGGYEGKVLIADNFDEPLPEEMLKLFEGG